MYFSLLRELSGCSDNAFVLLRSMPGKERRSGIPAVAGMTDLLFAA